MQPEEKARIKINKQLMDAGWSIVSRNEYVPNTTAAVKEALMQGNTESDYLLFVEDKAIAVVGMVFGSLTKSLWCILQTGIKYISKIY